MSDRAVIACGLAAGLFILSLPAAADVGFRVEGGRLATWLSDENGVYLEPDRVFEAELLYNPIENIVSTDEPGFYGEAGTLVGSQLGFDIRRALRAWDGAGFGQISPTTMTIEKPLIGSVTTPLLDPPAPLAGLSMLVPAGGLHDHYEHILDANTPGIYLLELELRTSAAGVGNSLPFWFVFNYGRPAAEHEASIVWVRENMVPAPGAGALLAGAALLARRRRR